MKTLSFPLAFMMSAANSGGTFAEQPAKPRHALFVKLIQQVREWNQRYMQDDSRDRDDDRDGFHDIFLFVPHR